MFCSVAQPVTEFNSFTVDGRPGQKWITLKRKFGEEEDIKIEATMFAGSKSSAAAEGDSDLYFRITLVVSIYKEGSDSMLEILCTAWPDCILIKNLGTRKCGHMPTKIYLGPALEYDNFLFLLLFCCLGVKEAEICRICLLASRIVCLLFGP